MRTTRQLSITLPTEMAEAVKAKVKTGEYATESEVVREVLLAQDKTIDQWLHQSVGPAYDGSRAIPRGQLWLNKCALVSSPSKPRGEIQRRLRS